MKSSQVPLTPAFLSAVADGDLHNAMVAATPGGIEAQEAAGQAMLTLKFNQLPKEYLHWRGEGTARECFERLGFKFGNDIDELFVSITPPAGWTMRAAPNHSMWNYIHDDQGRIRGGVFYKAAFYDRRANVRLNTRYEGGGDYRDGKRYSVVKDTATGNVLIEYGPTEDWNQSEKEDRITFEWLDAQFPEWRNVEAYW
jgi:hypothetical protein